MKDCSSKLFKKLVAASQKNLQSMDRAAETVFSSVRRIMGERVTSTSKEGMFREVMRKFLFYDMILKMVP